MIGGTENRGTYRKTMGGTVKKTPDWAPVFNDEMADFWSGEVLWNCSLAQYTTLGVGGKAEALVFPRGCKELSLLVQGLRKINVNWYVLGMGSNVLIAEQGLDGVVIVLGRNFSHFALEQSDDQSVLIKVQAGCSLNKLVKWTVDNGYAGLEFAAGIPGTVGGAIAMNAGAWHREIKDVLSLVTILDKTGCMRVVKVSDMNFAYRSWGEQEDKIALEGYFSLRKESPEKVAGRYHEYKRQRKEKQPQYPSAGSFFKNPKGEKAAGKLIEDAGLKGFSVGGAMVSPKHANFIVNTGQAMSTDIIKVMEKVIKTVHEKFNVLLEPEVKILGFEADK